LEEFKFDDAHDEVSEVLEFVAETVVEDGAGVVAFLVVFDIHVDELQTLRSCQIELFD